MSNMVPVMDKKAFLRGFLKRYQLKRRECAWLLNYLMNDDSLMERVHFLSRSEGAPKALVISAQGVDQIPFSFRKNHHVTTDCEKAFHDIRLNQTEDIYIELHFSGVSTSTQYLAVLEDNPFLPETKERVEAIEKRAEELLTQSIQEFQRKRLEEAIDKALDQGDRTAFMTLTEELKKLDETEPSSLLLDSDESED
ncbi:ReoY family proteolytic degradation factor [Shouchella shacheensis]|uniref:ReoY family proteolytic degradation factor n=1 Tax=Shouchella shacheensis TaxID=1649580 RepID=UPI0007401037|nr:ReoY family proteolytic degradation factor [Shouchella shacheensis]